MSARHLVLLALLLTLWPSALVRADCAANDLNGAPALPPELAQLVAPPATEDARARWSETAERLDGLRRRARAEAVRAQVDTLEALAQVLDGILESYDGTGATAHRLRFADVQPRACPPDPETGLALCAWQALGGAIQVPWDEPAPWSCDAKTLLFAHLSAARQLIARLADTEIAHVAADLKQAAAAWQRYVESGFSQYPHEVLLNGLLLEDESWSPPPHQIIAFHLAVGIGTTPMQKQDDRRREAAMVLVVEAAGYVRYLGSFRHHLGVSFAGMLPNFVWSDVGVGPMLHFDGVGVGYAFGLKGDKPQTLLVTFDVTRGIDDGLLGKHAKGWVQDRLR